MLEKDVRGLFQVFFLVELVVLGFVFEFFLGLLCSCGRWFRVGDFLFFYLISGDGGVSFLRYFKIMRDGWDKVDKNIIIFVVIYISIY